MVPDYLKYARTSYGGLTIAPIGLAAGEVIPSDPYRTALVIFAPVTNRITLGFDATVSDGNGIVMVAGQAPMYFDAERHWPFIQKAIFGITVVAASTLFYVFTSNKDCEVESISGGLTGEFTSGPQSTLDYARP